MNDVLGALVATDEFEQAVRIVAALVLSGAVGFERESRDQSAGLRTHMLVGVGACLFTLLMIILVERYETDAVRADPVRIVSAITSSVAFLAAGAIIQSRGTVKGLTTGGSLWMAGAIGLGCGLGEFVLALIAVAAAMIVLVSVRTWEMKMFPDGRKSLPASAGRREDREVTGARHAVDDKDRYRNNLHQSS